MIGESAAQAKHDAHALVGEAMAECERLLRVAGEMSAEATRSATTSPRPIEEVERHLSRLPDLAQGEAQRIRQMVQTETEQMLDLSARTISTIHARNAAEPRRSRCSAAAGAAEATEGEGLKGMARKLTQRPKRIRSARRKASSRQPGQGLGNEDLAGGGGE